jgi:hypothetical protein
MRTGLFLAAGFLLLGASLILGRLFSSNYPDAVRWSVIMFVCMWLALTGANMWVGVARAGYSVAEELPIMLLLFGLPALSAVLLKWRFF